MHNSYFIVLSLSHLAPNTLTPVSHATAKSPLQLHNRSAILSQFTSAALKVLIHDVTTKSSIACEQALCLGKKISRKGKGRGERAFSLFPLPNSPLDQRPVHRLKALVLRLQLEFLKVLRFSFLVSRFRFR